MTTIDVHDRKLRCTCYPTGTPDAFREMILRGPALAHPTVLMRKSVITTLGGLRDEAVIAEARRRVGGPGLYADHRRQFRSRQHADRSEIRDAG